MQDNACCIDKLEIYRIDKDGNWNLEIETNNTPSIWQRFLRCIGLYKCAGDAFTNWMINDLAVYTAGKLTHASVGTSSANPTNYDLTDLVSPVMTRATVTTAYVNVYGTNATYPDTVQYTIVMTATGDYTLREAGLHTALTSGNMGSRQTFDDWPVTNGESFALVWKITYGRG